MSESEDLVSRIQKKLERFSERERRLLAVMVVVLSTMFLALTIGVSMRTLNKWNARIEEQRTALTALMAQRESYIAQAQQDELMRERLAANNLNLATFIEARANDAGVGRPRNFRDHQQPIREGRVTAFQTTASFTGMSLEDLDILLNEILMSGELVFVQRINFEPGRGRGSQDGLQIELTLVTYRSTGES